MKRQQRERSRAKALALTERQYDDFLLGEKHDRFRRIEPFKTMSAHIKHQCSICGRVWKPSPKMSMEDDYYCPSCVLHHRNNMERFENPILDWTSAVPNTFYLYRVTDFKSKEEFYKYGRTQHLSSDQRYSSTERKKYKMDLIYEVRGPLISTTAVENFWKTVANDQKLRPTFSEKEFHGATECIRLTAELYAMMLEISNHIMTLDLKGYRKFGLEELEQTRRSPLLQLIEAQHEQSRKTQSTSDE